MRIIDTGDFLKKLNRIFDEASKRDFTDIFSESYHSEDEVKEETKLEPEEKTFKPQAPTYSPTKEAIDSVEEADYLKYPCDVPTTKDINQFFVFSFHSKIRIIFSAITKIVEDVERHRPFGVDIKLTATFKTNPYDDRSLCFHGISEVWGFLNVVRHQKTYSQNDQHEFCCAISIIPLKAEGVSEEIIAEANKNQSMVSSYVFNMLNYLLPSDINIKTETTKTNGSSSTEIMITASDVI